MVSRNKIIAYGPNDNADIKSRRRVKIDASIVEIKTCVIKCLW
jgi:hypothetical protein